MATTLTEPYTWKSTAEVQQKNTMRNAMLGSSPSPFTNPAAPSPAPGTPSPAPSGTGQPPSGASTPPGGSPFQLPKTFSEAMRSGMDREANIGAAQQNIAQGFQPLTAENPGDVLARNNLRKEMDAGLRAAKEQSLLMRRGQTGQLAGDVGNYISTSMIPQAANAEAQLHANRLAADERRAQAAHGNLQAMEGLASQEDLGLKDLAAREKLGLAGLESQERMQDKGIASTEKVAFANLADRAVDRSWQSTENLAEREARASESSLARELQKYLGEKELNIDDRRLAEEIRQFDGDQDFKKWATQAGLDDAAADRVWKSHEADVGRKWETGERLSSEEHQVNLTRLSGEIESGKLRLQQTLNLDTLEKQQAHDKVMAAVNNEYLTNRDTRQMTHEQAMEAARATYASQLSAQGYSQEQALQAADALVRTAEAARIRTHETRLAEAEMLYKYRALADQKQLSQQEIQVKRDAMSNELTLGLKELGLKETQITAAVKSQDLQDQMGVFATMMEMAGDDADAVQFASEQFLGLLKSRGLVTPEQYTAGLEAIRRGEAKPVTMVGPSQTSPTPLGINAGGRTAR